MEQENQGTGGKAYRGFGCKALSRGGDQDQNWLTLYHKRCYVLQKSNVAKTQWWCQIYIKMRSFPIRHLLGVII